MRVPHGHAHDSERVAASPHADSRHRRASGLARDRSVAIGSTETSFSPGLRFPWIDEIEKLCWIPTID